MNRLLFILIFLSIFFSCKKDKEDISPATLVIDSFQPSDEIMFNPERGFTKFFDTEASNYVPLDINALNNIKQSKISLIYRGFYLDNFLNSPISQTYLDKIQNDFDVLRSAGLKAVIRFAYSKNQNSSIQEAPKAIMLNHIQQLKPIFEKNSDVIFVVNAGFIGTWGEWYYTSQPEFGKASNPNFTNRNEILEALLKALPANRMVQLRTPYYKKMMYKTDPLSSKEGFNLSSKSRIGHHNDCFLASENDYGTYADIKSDYAYLEKETLYTPMGGETCNPNPPRSSCQTALDELKKFHWSFLSIDYHPTVLQSWRTGSCFTEIENKLGYRFQINSITVPQSISKAKKFQLILKIQNNGFASLFNERKAYIVLKNKTDNKIYKISLNSDPRKWLGTINIDEALSLPPDITPGSYQLFLHLPDADQKIASRPEYAIQFANKNTFEPTTGFNNLNSTILIEE